MTALLRPDETLTLGVNVIVRPGDITGSTWIDDECIHETIVAPQDWVALTGPCQNEDCFRGLVNLDEDGDGDLHGEPCPDCRDGRRIVPLYRRYDTIEDTAIGRVLVGRGSIEVVPVVKGKVTDLPCIELNGRLDVLPYRLSHAIPGRDFVIVIDCVEVMS